MKHWLMLAALVGALASPDVAALAQTTPGTSGGEWPLANFDYANTRAVTQSAISSANVAQLGVAWTSGVNGVAAFGALATSPVVVNGTVYLQDLRSNVYAIELQTGRLKWQKRYDAETVGPLGPAVDSGKVFVESDPHTVAALDAASGEELWSVPVGPTDLQGIDQQLTAFDGSLYLSTVPGPSTSKFYSAGGLGVIYVLDEQSGAEKWSFDTVKDGDLWGHPEVNSGGGAWYPPAIDTTSGVSYWGIGNPAPFPGTPDFPNGSSRPGPNLYTNAAIALDASGQLLWYKQPKAVDITDGDFEASPIIVKASANGPARDVVIGAGKAGLVAAFDKQSGDQLWKTAVGVHQNDETTSFPADSLEEVFPGEFGGVETPMAYADGTVYVPVANAGTDYSATAAGATHFASATGNLTAIDVSTGKVIWDVPLDSPDFAGATVVGDLVFTSTYAGNVLAFDRATGNQVWQWRAPGGVNGFMSVVGDTVLVPVGLASDPMLVALKIGASGSIPASQSSTPSTQGQLGAGTQLSVTTTADNPLAFDAKARTVAPGDQVTVAYTNDSPIQHNWHVYNGSDATAPSIAETPIKSGPGDVETVSFTAPSEPGSYWYQCDVHPTFMTGHLEVRSPTAS